MGATGGKGAMVKKRKNFSNVAMDRKTHNIRCKLAKHPDKLHRLPLTTTALCHILMREMPK